ncbi:hypothetical protein LguiB_031622 [Lonicera macranthoides]
MRILHIVEALSLKSACYMGCINVVRLVFGKQIKITAFHLNFSINLVQMISRSKKELRSFSLTLRIYTYT